MSMLVALAVTSSFLSIVFAGPVPSSPPRNQFSQPLLSSLSFENATVASSQRPQRHNATSVNKVGVSTYSLGHGTMFHQSTTRSLSTESTTFTRKHHPTLSHVPHIPSHRTRAANHLSAHTTWRHRLAHSSQAVSRLSFSHPVPHFTFRPVPIPRPSSLHRTFYPSSFPSGTVHFTYPAPRSTSPSFPYPPLPNEDETPDTRKFRIILGCIGALFAVVIIALVFTLWRWRQAVKNLRSRRNSAGTERFRRSRLSVIGTSASSEDPLGTRIPERPAELPSLEVSGGLSSAESEVLRIGHDTSSLSSFPAVPAARGADSLLRPTNVQLSIFSINPFNPGKHGQPDRPIDSSPKLDAGVSLSRAFSTHSQDSYDFPTSPENFSPSLVPESLVAHPPPVRNSSQVFQSSPVQSIRGSIAEALSMISVPDRLSGSAVVLDGKSLKSSKSVRSSKSGRFRFSHISTTSFRRQRKSLATSIETKASSVKTLPSPDLQDVSILFSASQDSIRIGMPSVPPTSFADGRFALLYDPIPHSPLDIPDSLMSKDSNLKEDHFAFNPLSTSTPRRHRYKTHVHDVESHQHASVLRASIMNNSLVSLPPASPSSDGIGFGGAISSSGSMSSLGVPAYGSGYSRYLRHDGPIASVGSGSLKTLSIPSSPSHTSPKSMPPSPPSPDRPPKVVLASISKQSLVLGRAMKALEDDLVSDTSRSPTKSAKSISSSRSAERNVRVEDRDSGDEDYWPKLSPPTISVTYSDSVSSMDITTAANVEGESNGLRTSVSLPSSKSGLSLIIADVLEENGDMTTIAEEPTLDGLDEVGDDSLYPVPPVRLPPSHWLKRLSRSPDTHQLSTEASDLLPHDINQIKDDNVSSASNFASRIPFTPDKLNAQRSMTPSTIVNEEDISTLVNGSSLDLSPGNRGSNTIAFPRLSVSVIPSFDAETSALAAALTGLDDEPNDVDLGLGSPMEDDEDETSSFEGCLDDYTLYQRTNFHGFHSDTDPSPAGEYGDGSMEDTEDAYYDTGYDEYEDVDLAYMSRDAHPATPRPSEVALRAIEREGRYLEAEQVTRHMEVVRSNRQRFTPIVSSPLRTCTGRFSTLSASSAASADSTASEYSRLSVLQLNVEVA